jgi:hypothetical protein
LAVPYSLLNRERIVMLATLKPELNNYAMNSNYENHPDVFIISSRLWNTDSRRSFRVININYNYN